MKKKECWNVKSGGFYCFLIWLLIVLVAASLLGLIACFAIYFTKDCCCLKKQVMDLGNLLALSFQGSAMALTLLVAVKTYWTSRKIENVKGLAQIREMLSSYDNMEVHQRIANPNPQANKKVVKSVIEEKENGDDFFSYYQKNEHIVNNYLGTLELVKIYLEEGIISEEDFYNQFGYRIENIGKIRETLESDKEEAHYWIDLFRLCDKMPELAERSRKRYAKYCETKQTNKDC